MWDYEQLQREDGERAGRVPIAQDCSSKDGVKRKGPVVSLNTMTGSTSAFKTAFKSNRRVPDTQQSFPQTLGNVTLTKGVTYQITTGGWVSSDG